MKKAPKTSNPLRENTRDAALLELPRMITRAGDCQDADSSEQLMGHIASGAVSFGFFALQRELPGLREGSHCRIVQLEGVETRSDPARGASTTSRH